MWIDEERLWEQCSKWVWATLLYKMPILGSRFWHIFSGNL